MTVIKKSGRKEEFSVEKLSNSIKAANMSTDESLNITLTVAEFQQIVKGKELMTTQQIDVVVYGLLYSKGLLKTLMKYVDYDKR